MSELTVVILAAGEGKRMRSRLPKVLHRLCGRPLVAYPLRAARAVTDQIVMVVGPERGDLVACRRYRRTIRGAARAAGHRPRAPAGPAALRRRHDRSCCRATRRSCPATTIERLVTHHRATRAAATIADRGGRSADGATAGSSARVAASPGSWRSATPPTTRRPSPRSTPACTASRRDGCGRRWPRSAPTNDQGEYYLTDVIGILARAGERIEAITTDDPVEALGVNDRKQLAAVAAIQRRRILDRLMEDGVTILDPASHLHRGHGDHRPRHRRLSHRRSSRGTRSSGATA